jgi:hypothetical protein
VFDLKRFDFASSMMQMLPSFPESVWTPSASDLWRLWNGVKTKRASVCHCSELEDAEHLLSALSAECWDARICMSK